MWSRMTPVLFSEVNVSIIILLIVNIQFPPIKTSSAGVGDGAASENVAESFFLVQAFNLQSQLYFLHSETKTRTSPEHVLIF